MKNTDPYSKEELEQTPILRDLPREETFSFPEGYFNAFVKRLMERIEEEKILGNGSALKKLSGELIDKEENPFKVPADYFDNFEERLQARLEDEMIEEEAPILSAIPKKETFQVPDTYFEQVQISIPDEEKAGKVRKLNQSSFTSGWIRYAVGIAATLLVAVGIFQWNVEPAESEFASADIPSTELLAALDFQYYDVYELVEDIDPETLEDLQLVGPVNDLDLNGVELLDALEGLDISDEELLDLIEVE